MSLPRKSSKRMGHQVLESLRVKIQNGAYQPGQQIPPEMELARTLGVSRGTLRQALQVLVDEGLLERIPGKGTFLNTEGTLLSERTARSKLMAILVPSLRDKLSSDMISGAERVVRQQGYSLIFSQSNHSPVIEREQILQLVKQEVSGIMLFPIAVPEEAQFVLDLKNQGVPVVSIDRHIPGADTPAVMADHYGGAYQATKHLLELGHRRIVCINNLTLATSVSERVRGYEQAMRDANLLPYAPVPVLGKSTLEADAAPPIISEGELALVEHMLGVKEKPTAIFCINDFIAIGVMRHCLEKGLRIPEDMAVVGFDDSPFAPFTQVPLTTVAQSGFEIGRKAAEVLFGLLSSPQTAARTVCVPTRLVIRKSSGSGSG
jgi:GntR family transcriptional regulator of arabinose operon